MTYNFIFVASEPGAQHSQEKGRDRLGQCHDNVTEWSRQHDSPIGQHYKVITSVHCHWSGTSPDMTFNVVRMENPQQLAF